MTITIILNWHLALPILCQVQFVMLMFQQVHCVTENHSYVLSYLKSYFYHQVIVGLLIPSIFIVTKVIMSIFHCIVQPLSLYLDASCDDANTEISKLPFREYCCEYLQVYNPPEI